MKLGASQKDDGLLEVHKSGGQIWRTLNELHLNKLCQAWFLRKTVNKLLIASNSSSSLYECSTLQRRLHGICMVFRNKNTSRNFHRLEQLSPPHYFFLIGRESTFIQIHLYTYTGFAPLLTIQQSQSAKGVSESQSEHGWKSSSAISHQSTLCDTIRLIHWSWEQGVFQPQPQEGGKRLVRQQQGYHSCTQPQCRHGVQAERAWVRYNSHASTSYTVVFLKGSHTVQTRLSTPVFQASRLQWCINPYA